MDESKECRKGWRLEADPGTEAMPKKKRPDRLLVWLKPCFPAVRHFTRRRLRKGAIFEGRVRIMPNKQFCDLYPRFLETTETIASPSRLNNRWRAIISWNQTILAGRRIIDLGSHDGRWSFAASKVGAAYVLGIEGRAHLVDKALGNFKFYNVPSAAYRFITGDAVEKLKEIEKGSADVMMCLGFFYHTMEHMRLLLEARRIGIRYLIIDTGISPALESTITLAFEPIGDTRNSIDYGRTGREKALVGIPSKSALTAMLDYAGYDVVSFDWHDGSVREWLDLQDYYERSRVTIRATIREPATV
jgi:hypothetical protein